MISLTEIVDVSKILSLINQIQSLMFTSCAYLVLDKSDQVLFQLANDYDRQSRSESNGDKSVCSAGLATGQKKWSI